MFSTSITSHQMYLDQRLNDPCCGSHPKCILTVPKWHGPSSLVRPVILPYLTQVVIEVIHLIVPPYERTLLTPCVCAWSESLFFHWRTGMNSCRSTCRIATKNHSFPDSCVYIHDKIGVKTVSDNACITRNYPPKSGSTKIQKHLLKNFHVLCNTPGFHFELSVFSWCFFP